MKTACLYTRKHSDGGRRERYLANTNTNRARNYAVIDGEKWTNRGLVVGDHEVFTADHEKQIHYSCGQRVRIGDLFIAPRWGTCKVKSFDRLNHCAVAVNTCTGEEFDMLGRDTFSESDLISRFCRDSNVNCLTRLQSDL